MTERTRGRVFATSRLALGAGALIAATIIGCQEEPVAVAPPPPPPPAPPAAPPKPKVTPVKDLMVQFSIDERVYLPEDEAPDNDPDRIALLTFFDGFARGDTATLGGMLSLLDRGELDELARTEAWTRTVENIDSIELETGTGPVGEDCVLALYDIDGKFQAQLWYYEGSGNDYTFDAAPSPPDIVQKLSGDNWIQKWHELLEQERALAAALDVEPDLAPVDLDETGEAPSSSGSAPGMAPGGPGILPGGPASPHRRKPPPPRRPPGPGGPGGPG